MWPKKKKRSIRPWGSGETCVSEEGQVLHSHQWVLSPCPPPASRYLLPTLCALGQNSESLTGEPWEEPPPPSLPAAPCLAGSTVLKGCLEKQALRGERRGSDLRSGGGRSKDPHRALPTGSARESPSVLTWRPSKLSGPQRLDLGQRTGVRTSSPPGAEEEGSQAGTGRRAGGGAARVLGHRVPVPACPASGTCSSAWGRSFTLHGHAPER